jgi:FlaA1/EpsC-like NDP-sugar epimerase
MIDEIIKEDIARIESAVEGDAFEGKKVLVTGGAGFIGSWLCDVLVSFDSEVVALDDLSTGRIRNIDHLTKNPKFKFVQGDACAFQSKDKLDFVLHLAGHASPEEYQTHPIETLQASSFGSANMLELLRLQKCMGPQRLYLRQRVTGEKLTLLDLGHVMTKEKDLQKHYSWLTTNSTGWM